jgi:hypothetical protein
VDGTGQDVRTLAMTVGSVTELKLLLQSQRGEDFFCMAYLSDAQGNVRQKWARLPRGGPGLMARQTGSLAYKTSPAVLSRSNPVAMPAKEILVSPPDGVVANRGELQGVSRPGSTDGPFCPAGSRSIAKALLHRHRVRAVFVNGSEVPRGSTPLTGRRWHEMTPVISDADHGNSQSSCRNIGKSKQIRRQSGSEE